MAMHSGSILLFFAACFDLSETAIDIFLQTC